MARHQWATARLWEGIVGAADDAWRDGIEILATSPLREPEVSRQQSTIGRRLQRLADQARSRLRTDAAQDRARIYGEILVTCAGCHVAPPPSASLDEVVDDLREMRELPIPRSSTHGSASFREP